MDLSKYMFYAGTARGFLLSTTDKPNNIKSAKPDEPSEITALSFGRTDEEIFIGYQSGNVKIYNPLENNYSDDLKNLEGEGRIVGLNCVNKNVIIAKHDGVINIWRGKRNSHFDIGIDQKGSLDCMAYNTENIVGTGGEFNDFKLWNIETHQCTFRAKSMGHDSLNLPIPTSIRGITFFQDDRYSSACCTKEGHVLLYDYRAQRRPVTKFLEKKASYSTITSAYREKKCLVGTTRGYMQLLDMKAGKCLKTFTTFTGSVTSIVCDPLEPYVATTCLDRFLRVHNLETKELLHKVYMKQNLTRLLMQPLIKEELKEEIQKEVEDKEYDEIFNNMETISDVDKERHKRKSKSLNSEDVTRKKKKKNKLGIKTNDEKKTAQH